MATDIPQAIRRLVVDRATGRCEYCLLHQDDAFTPHQIDHIISRKHGGSSAPGNLALACVRCNAWKGTDIASLGAEEILAPLYNPRRQIWSEHFRLEDDVVIPLTPAGTATVSLLRFNLHGRIAERRLLRTAGRYPQE